MEHRWGWMLLAVLMWASLGAAQQTAQGTAQQEVPKFRTTTRLVEVSVVALDKKRQPVTDLKPEEFTLFEDGKPRPIAFFHFDGAEEPQRKPLLAAPGAPALFSNRPEYLAGAPRNVTALVVDALNTAPEDHARVRAEVYKYLRQVPPQTRIGIFLLGYRMTILHDFTDDAESLRERLRKAPAELPTFGMLDVAKTIDDAEQWIQLLGFDTKDPDALNAQAPRLLDFLRQSIAMDMSANERARQNRTYLTLAHLDALARHLESIPGRKNIVWIGSGISSVSIYGQGMGRGGGVSHYEEAIQEVSRRIAQRGGALYIVDARGLDARGGLTDGIDPSRGGVVNLRSRIFEREQANEAASTDTRPAMFHMAATTGGRVFNTTNDMASGLEQAAVDVQGSYSLAFYAPEQPDGKWHNLKVRSNRSGLELLYREGYIAEAPAAETGGAWTDNQWRSAIANPLGSGAILLTARVWPGNEPGAWRLEVQIEPNSVYFRRAGDLLLGDLELSVAEVTAEGKAAFRTESANLRLDPEKWQAAQQLGIPYSRTWKTIPAATRLRVIVRDKIADRFGTLDIPINKRGP
jgi:VWFA-related protein